MIEIDAPAKINLFLNVYEKDFADDYHKIETIMQAINLSDRLKLEIIDEEGIFIESVGYKVPQGSENLIYKACLLFLERYKDLIPKKKIGIRVELEKNIPVAAGLGGGSSDAAAVLIGLTRLLHLNLKKTDLIELASVLGSDVPFFILRKIALCKGTGINVVPLPYKHDFWFILVYQNFGISTSWAYEQYDKHCFYKQKNIDEMMNALKAGDLKEIGKCIFNSFEQTIFAYYPFLSSIKADLLAVGSLGVGLSGSGPTMFALVENDKKAWEIQIHLEKKNIQAQITRAKNF